MHFADTGKMNCESVKTKNSRTLDLNWCTQDVYRKGQNVLCHKII